MKLHWISVCARMWMMPQMMAFSSIVGIITWFFPIALFLYVSLVLAILHQIWVIYCFLRWHFDRVEITDFGPRLTEGVIITHEKKLRMNGITDVTVRQSLLGQLLGYGTITLEQMGRKEPERRIDYVAHPYDFFRELCSEVEGEETSRGMGISREALWDSLRSE